MNYLSKTILLSACVALVSFSAQAADKKMGIKSKCDISKIKSMSKEQVRFCAKNTFGPEKKGWIWIESVVGK